MFVICALLCSVTSVMSLCNPMDYSPPGSSVHGILQARILEGCHALLQEIVPTWGLNLGPPHCRWILYCLSQILYHCCSQTPQEANSLRRTTQIVKCSLLHQRVQSSFLLARDSDQILWQPFISKVYVPKPTSPNFSSLLSKMLERDTIRLQSWFTLQRSSSHAV